MNYLTWTLRRLAFVAVVLLSVVTITFLISHAIGSSIGNPIAAWLGRSAALYPNLVETYTKEYHLNDPIWVQYYYYLVGVSHGNLGFSPTRGFLPVAVVIGETLPFTLQLALFGFVISIIIAIPLGVMAARYHHTRIDGSIRAFYLVTYSSPTFFVGLILLIAFSYIFKILPSGGAFDPTVQSPTWITGLPLVDSALEGNWTYFYDALQHVILPALALALAAFGVLTRVLRSSLLDVMSANYIRAARAKGLDENTIFYGHALRNAMIPVVTLSSLMMVSLVTGTIFVENVFAYPGMGQYVVGAVIGQDYPGILATTLVYAVVIVITNLMADILYALVDPQIRLG